MEELLSKFPVENDRNPTFFLIKQSTKSAIHFLSSFLFDACSDPSKLYSTKFDAFDTIHDSKFPNVGEFSSTIITMVPTNSAEFYGIAYYFTSHKISNW